MRNVKIAVFIMTFLIFIGLALLIYGMTMKKSLIPTEGSLSLPEGATVKLISSYQDQLAVYFNVGSEEYVYFYNPQKNWVEAKIRVERKP